jgi:hypothetical protein
VGNIGTTIAICFFKLFCLLRQHGKKNLFKWGCLYRGIHEFDFENTQETVFVCFGKIEINHAGIYCIDTYSRKF